MDHRSVSAPAGTAKQGKALSHLAARHLGSAEEVQEAAEPEVQAGRGGKNQPELQFLSDSVIL